MTYVPFAWQVSRRDVVGYAHVDVSRAIVSVSLIASGASLASAAYSSMTITKAGKAHN
jgi:hypothetical protein